MKKTYIGRSSTTGRYTIVRGKPESTDRHKHRSVDVFTSSTGTEIVIVNTDKLNRTTNAGAGKKFSK